LEFLIIQMYRIRTECKRFITSQAPFFSASLYYLLLTQ